MPHIAYYSLHEDEEEKFRRIEKCLTTHNHPDKENMIAHARLQTRVKQQNDARCVLSHKNVTVHTDGKLVAKLWNVEIGDSTATACFTLVERNANGTLHRMFEVKPDTQILVEEVAQYA